MSKQISQDSQDKKVSKDTTIFNKSNSTITTKFWKTVNIYKGLNDKFWFGFLNCNDLKVKLNKAFDPIERALLTKVINKKSLYERGIMGTRNLENYYSDPVTIACG